MKLCFRALSVIALLSASLSLCTQLIAQQPAASATAAAPVSAAMPSATMQASLGMLRDTINGMHADKWKLPGALRNEMEENLNSIRNDLDTTLPALLATADAAPSKVSQVLPAYRNIEALYDVVLRVDAAARVGAPAQQTAALDHTLLSLDASRRSLGDRLVLNAQGQEKQVTDLQASLRTAQSTPAAAPVCPAPAPATPAKKKRSAKQPAKPAPKPTAKPAG